ncbi:MAG: hypothetical protein WC607_02855 [Candidatus Micrarchaeia archaeon]
MKLEDAIARIDADLSEREGRQAALLAKTRDAIRLCAKAIKDVHAGTEPDLTVLEAAVTEIKGLSQGFDGLCFSVYQEYAEIKCYLALAARREPPDYEELGIPYLAWLTGLCDCAGELRRAMQISLIKGDRASAEYYFAKLEWIYDNVMTLKYSGSIAGSLKSKQDAARKLVEYARSELLK